MMRGLAAAGFLGLAILFLGIAVSGGPPWVWLLAVGNGALSAANLIAYMSNEPGREKPPTP